MRKLILLSTALLLAGLLASPAHAARLWDGGGDNWWEQDWDHDFEWEYDGPSIRDRIGDFVDDWREDGGSKCDIQLLSFLSQDCKDDPRPGAGVPEPSAALVFGVGFVVVGAAMRRRGRR